MFTREELESLSLAKLKKLVDYLQIKIDYKTMKKDDIIDAILDSTEVSVPQEDHIEPPRYSVRVKRILDSKRRDV